MKVNHLKQLSAFGQSVWLNYIRYDMIIGGGEDRQRLNSKKPEKRARKEAETQPVTKRRTPALYAGGIAVALLAGLLAVGCQTPITTTRSSATTSSLTSGASSTTSAADISLGETIYLYGTDASGENIPRSGVTGMMGSAFTCATCHGSDTRGQTIGIMMDQVQVPDIRWSTLTETPTDPEDVAFNPDSFFLAVTQGIDPTGATLKTFKPRWQLTRNESDAIIEYLKTR